MCETDSLLKQQEWRVIDQSSVGPQFPALESFAMDDTFCASVGSGKSMAVARAWVHHQTVVLGIQDTKLPFLKKGVDYLKEHDFQAIVRNSGGLAVVLDEGVLNLSLIFPENERKIEINRGYDAMWELVQLMFADFQVEMEAREITGSYCPGSYDLSINGRKFAGISQRRIRNGVAVQIYLCVNGSGAERASLVKGFYEAAKGDAETKFTYPDIMPSVMASLSELLDVRLSVQDVMLRFLHVLKEHSGRIFSDSLSVEEWPLYEAYLTRVVERNDKVFDSLKED
ncbi:MULTISPECIES: lipoate--protein ligase family protein [Peribacillus]|uniref:lipoate--protein ligase family protein n=1 Tax=Peribacillus TaxID=2675229 RepID=UPI00191215C4|nr:MULTISPECIES: lipoate--protein ligase family protein [unclassified Peribacillus]MBK5444118.1 lipoate--protein ligase family protein [Peribacillus sp. TH24]MBK5461162.1 lipoate--protein ligase family protein [Peribacillus sp. TH27]MBK5485517.1 lipoate--protein ligase family protein [Peribacillus sp. TH16]MBK5499304.1 lipoate--protein ligase family protein [Peribacillus sp. TH14]WMX55597.1 lipoate--protein ligase family protein [Peribacillus sp. R9-11]